MIELPDHLPLPRSSRRASSHSSFDQLFTNLSPLLDSKLLGDRNYFSLILISPAANAVFSSIHKVDNVFTEIFVKQETRKLTGKELDFQTHYKI